MKSSNKTEVGKRRRDANKSEESTMCQSWTYKGVTVYRADANSFGIRWNALMDIGVCLRADTKEGMKQLITEVLQKGKCRV